MNINQLEYLVAAVNAGSYANAAKVLYISPQAVSKAISDLEKELKIELFVKSGRGIVPTTYGSLLASKAKEIVCSCADFKNVARSLQAGSGENGQVYGSFSIAVASSPYEGGVIPRTLFDAFVNQYSGVNLSLSYSSSGSCLAALLEGIVEAAIILGRYEGSKHCCTKIYDGVLRLAMSNDNPLAYNERTTLNDTKSFPIAKPHDLRYCFRIISDQFQKRGMKPTFVDVSPTVYEYSRFLHEKQGLIFVHYDSSLEDVFENVNYISFTKEDEIRIPICFIYPIIDDDRLYLLLQQSLIKNMKSEIMRFNT